MSKIESYKPGSFVWSELASSDPDAAKKFYGDMFDWTYTDAPEPNGGVYTIFKYDGNSAAALYRAPAGMPPNWGVYFSAPDLGASTAKARDLGAEIVMGPQDIGPPGSMSVIKDPQGVHFSLWQAKGTIGATHGGPLGRVVWPELATPDPVGAVAFYSALLGWKTKPDSGFETAQYLEWQNYGESIGGLMPMRGDEWKGVPPHWMIYITVANCDERAAHAASLGGSIRVPPTDIPNTGRFSVLADPQGAHFSIIQMASRHQPAAG
jgi:predicted enzyme related to lactoylglutathione lyase